MMRFRRGSGAFLGRIVALLLAGSSSVMPLAVMARPISGENVMLQANAAAISTSAVDRRLVICQVEPKLLHTQWAPSMNAGRQVRAGQIPVRVHGPRSCTGGANRLGAGYIRYLATSSVVKARVHLKG